jgi:hypothetical protein
MPERATAFTGSAGEHYVAFVLSSRGYPVAMTRGGSQTVDLMVAGKDGHGTISIQVKTANWAWRERKRTPENSFWEWDVGAKARTMTGDSLYYAFVDLRSYPKHAAEGLHPQVFIVPSSVVAGSLGEGWTRYMFRISLARKDEFYERWDLITSRLEPTLVPVPDELQEPENS